MGKLRIIKNRIYSDYLMPSRLGEYEELIVKLIKNGYKHVTFRDYKYMLKNNLLQNKKYFINRHDIDTDTDTATAKEFFSIEKQHNVVATYYFRMCTLDFDFMKEIESYGSEVGYHFEEMAQFAKDNHIHSRDELMNGMDKIKKIFKGNFKMIENRLGVKLKTVCSHGDFINRKLNIVNNEITKDASLREELGIECEAYDKEIMNSFDVYVADRPYPAFYAPESVFEYIGKVNIICLLSHPRQWRVSPILNTKENMKRLYEEFSW